VTPCSVVVGYQHFRGPCCLSLHPETLMSYHNYIALQVRRPGLVILFCYIRPQLFEFCHILKNVLVICMLSFCAFWFLGYCFLKLSQEYEEFCLMHYITVKSRI
jgi:hypothetical protein